MELIAGLSKLKTLVNTSLSFNKDVYDQERLVEMQGIIKDLVTTYSTNLTENEIQRYFSSDVGYVTPKVDIRAVVFNAQGKLLLVQEKSDHTWALPGGWVDVGYSPGEIAQKETFEEAGLDVVPKQLLKVVDKPSTIILKVYNMCINFLSYAKPILRKSLPVLKPVTWLFSPKQKLNS